MEKNPLGTGIPEFSLEHVNSLKLKQSGEPW